MPRRRTYNRHAGGCRPSGCRRGRTLRMSALGLDVSKSQEQTLSSARSNPLSRVVTSDPSSSSTKPFSYKDNSTSSTPFISLSSSMSSSVLSTLTLLETTTYLSFNLGLTESPVPDGQVNLSWKNLDRLLYGINVVRYYASPRPIPGRQFPPYANDVVLLPCDRQRPLHP